jgi:RNA polymerase sigma factor (sigma-70 family)
MAKSPTADLLRRIHKLARVSDPPHADAQLLQAFVQGRDPAAFAALVERHGPLVLAVARRILHEPHDTEDVLQGTFLVLARKAGSIRKRASLGSWLHGVAYRLAKRARAQSARRRLHERQAPPREGSTPEAELGWREACVVLDEELHRLAEPHRLPLVLCYLQGHTQDEAARHAGWSLRTLRRRLERGRELLRLRLERRGVTLPAALLAAGLAHQAARSAVSAALVERTARAGLAFAAGGAAAGDPLSAAAASLAQGAIRAMWMVRLQIAGVVVLAAGVVAAATGRWSGGEAAGPPAAAPPKQVALATPPWNDDKDRRRQRARELLRRAVEMLESVGDDPDAAGELRHRTLADIAVLQARLDQPEESKKTFRQARRLIDAMQAGTSMELRELARAYARAGDAEQALAVARGPLPRDDNFVGNEGDFRDMVLRECAEALAQAGRGPEAFRVAGALSKKEVNRSVPGLLRADLALAQAQVGRSEQARRTLDSMGPDGYKVRVLTGVIHVHPHYTQLPERPGLALIEDQAGRHDQARRTLREAARVAQAVKDPAQRQWALTSVMCAQVRLGEVDAARKLLAEIPGEMWRNIAVAAVAEALAAAGRVPEARALIDALPRNDMKVHALCHLAAGQAQAGDRKAAAATFQEAISLTRALPEDLRLLHFNNIASAQARSGDFDAAQQTIREHLPDGTLARVSVAYHQAKAGQEDAALQTAQALSGNKWWHGNVIRYIAKIQAQQGKERNALKWIGKVSGAVLQANALLGLAEGLTEPPGD